MPGVKKVVRVRDSAVAVVADTWWHAKTALDAVKIEWDGGENAKVSSASIDAVLKEGLDAEQAFVHNKNGDSKAAIAGAAKKIEAVYDYPFQNHACMEPMNATALYTPDRCEVWCPTQNGEAALAATAEASGLPIGKCDVHKLHLGGGFGRRGFTDFVTQAVLIAKEMPGTPVKLLWSREEDMAQGRYHPIMKAKLTGGLDASGKLVGLQIRLSGQSILAGAIPAALVKGKDPLTFQGFWPSGDQSLEYSIPNLMIDHAMRNTHVPPGFWRGVNINQNAIFLECFMDELAHAAGQDALEFRRKLMADHPLSLAVLNAVAAKGGWGRKAPAGRYRGLAHFRAFGSYVAAVAEISVKDGNKVKVHRIVAATDTGYAVNPAQIERQIAGSFVYGLSALFSQECTVKDGSMRADELPRLRLDAHRADAEGRVDHHALRRVLGRRRRADHLRGGTGGAERVSRGDRQAHPLVPAEEPRHRDGVRGFAFVLLLALSRSAFSSDDIPASLTGAKGDPARGRAIVVNRQLGLCLLCHSGPFPEERFQGNLAPDLNGIGARLSEGQIRLRIVDPGRLNPATIMPAYFRSEGLTRVAPAFEGKSLLGAEQIEDVVAFLMTLK